MTEDLKFADWLISTGRAMGYATNSALAHAIGVPQPTVSRWKKGAKPSVEHLVSISDLFGIELKTLLVLSGHMQGDVSPESLALPTSEAERLIAESPLEEAFKELLQDFWQQRMHEEHRRLRDLVQGVQNAVTPTGDIRPTELDPWAEKALESDLSKHVQRLQQALGDTPPPITWILRVHPSRVMETGDLFAKAVEENVQMTQHIGEEDGYYTPSVHGTPPYWMLLGPAFETKEEAEAALRALRRAYPKMNAKEVEYHYAPEEEDPS